MPASVHESDRSALTRRRSVVSRLFGLATAITLAAAVAAARAATAPLDRFVRLSDQDILADADVRAIAQDNDGFLWFGARLRGLVRYDGHDVKVFQDNPGDPDSFGHKVIWSMTVDHDGSLWVGAVGGLARLDRATTTFTEFRHDPARPESLPTNVVLRVFEDHCHTLWVATQMGLSRLDDRTRGVFTTFVRPALWAGSATANTFRSITEDTTTGLLWLGTSDGLAAFDPRTGAFASWVNDPADRTSLCSNAVNKVLQSPDGSFWALTEAGLDRFQPRLTSIPQTTATPPRMTFTHHRRPTEATQPGINYVRDGLIDHKGRMWLATRGGVELFNPADGTFVTYQNRAGDSSSLSDNLTHTVFEDRSGNIWVGTYAGGVCRLRSDDKPFWIEQHIAGEPKSLNDGRITGLTFDATGRLWVATSNGLSRRDPGGWTNFLNDPADPASLPTNDLATVSAAPNGDIWIGSLYAGLIRYDGRTFHTMPVAPGRRSLPNGTYPFTGTQVNSILADSAGGLWIAARSYGLDYYRDGSFRHYNPDLGGDGVPTYNALLGSLGPGGDLWYATERQGLVRFDAATKRFTVFVPPSGRILNSDDHTFLNVARTSDGMLWVGAADGLLEFDPRAGQFVRQLSAHDGLLNSVVMGIVPDRRGHLWLGTTSGLADFDPGAGSVRWYDRADGLPSNVFAPRCSALGPDGRVYFGTRGGLVSFAPEEIRDHSDPPVVVITDVRWLDGEQADAGDENRCGIGAVRGPLRVAPGRLGFSLKFAALDFTAPEKNQYRYRLEGLESNWNRASATERAATYTALTPGHYVFHVQASNADGVWNRQGASIVVEVEPSVWQTAWFRGLVAAAFVAAIMLGVKWRLRRVRLRNASLERQVCERTAELEKEIAVRQQAEAALQQSHAELEQRVHDRTAALTASNASLAAEVEERRKVEAQLRHSQKMEAIGQLAGGMAHDFNNLLTIILGQVGLLTLDEHCDPEQRRQGLRDINAAAQRAAKLTRQLLVFSRREPMRLTIVDVNNLVRGEIEILRRLIGEDLVLQTAFADQPLPVLADAGMLQQLLLNLALNARDAMRQGGRLAIATRADALEKADSHRGPNALPGQYACISVSDTGCGIPADVLPRIFEPFFTTKASGKGTGLGLAITHGIVQQHRGWIQVDTSPGAGTTFHVWLPRQDSMAAAGRSDPSNAAKRGGGATVLVVEDEPEVRAVATHVLRHHGYRVLEASCGAEAMDCWKMHGHEISILLTDIIMPGRPNGRELAEQLRQERPTLRIITMSGYDPDATATRTGGASMMRCLRKPFTVDDLLAAFETEAAAKAANN